MSLAVPYIAYVAAESVHVSGVLAVVAAGLVRGRYSPKIVSAEMRILARSVWNILVFMLNSLIFILIGLQLSGVIGAAGRLQRRTSSRSPRSPSARWRSSCASPWVYPADPAAALAGSGGAPPAAAGEIHRQLVRHARHRLARRGARAAARDPQRRALSLPRPADLPHLRGHRRHAGGAGADARAAHPPARPRHPSAGLRDEHDARALRHGHARRWRRSTVMSRERRRARRSSLARIRAEFARAASRARRPPDRPCRRRRRPRGQHAPRCAARRARGTYPRLAVEPRSATMCCTTSRKSSTTRNQGCKR